MVFDELLGAAAHPVGEDDDLVFAEIGNRVDRHAAHGEEAPAEKQQRRAEDEEAVLERPLDESGDHPGWCDSGITIYEATGSRT